MAALVSVESAIAQTRTYGAAPSASTQPQRYRVDRRDMSSQSSTRFYAPRHDGRDVPGPLIITPGQIFAQHDDDGAGGHAGEHNANKTRPRMEHWVLRPVPTRHALVTYQPTITGDGAADETDVAEDNPPTPPQELLEPSDEVAKDRASGDVIEYPSDDCCTSRRRMGPYPDVGNYDDAYGRSVAAGHHAADYGAQGFLYGTPGNTWWDFYGYPYVGASMSWGWPYWGGYGYYGYPWGGYGLYGYGGYGYYSPRYYGYYGYSRPYGFYGYGYGGGFYRGCAPPLVRRTRCRGRR
jgi:hypothetical protein